MELDFMVMPLACSCSCGKSFCPQQHKVVYSRGLCRACLLVVSAVQIPQLPHQSGVYQAVGSNQVV